MKTSNDLITVVCTVSLLLGLSLLDTPRDASGQCLPQWMPTLGNISGLDGGVDSLATYDGELIVGGYFTQTGGMVRNYIARWNGSTWSSLGSGMNNSVGSLLVYGGELIAGGSFTVAGGVSANRIARWNGTSWSPLSGGTNGAVVALALYNGELVAGGFFTFAGGVSARGIARWNGTSWSSLGSGIGGWVSSLSIYEGNLIVGGDFTSAGGLSAYSIAQWDGTSWSTLGNGMPQSFSSVDALTVYNGELVAGGNFTIAGSIITGCIARWNGTSWWPLGGGLNSTMQALSIYNGELIAGGSFTTAGGVSVNRIARWNGTTWSPLGTGTDSRVSALAVYKSDLIAGGFFNTTGGQASPYLSVWYGCLSPSTLLVSPDTPASFGSVQLSTSADRTFIVRNVSQSQLIGGAAVLTPFSVVSGAPYQLAPGQETSVVVRFAPPSPGSYVRTLAFGAPNMMVLREVSGTGAVAPPNFGEIAGTVFRESAGASSAENATLAPGGTTLRGVMVRAYDSTLGRPVGKAVFTNAVGAFRLGKLPVGEFDLAFSVVGGFASEFIKEKVVRHIVVAAGLSTPQDVTLSPEQLNPALPEPVVLVRGWNPRHCWNGEPEPNDNEILYWHEVRTVLRGTNSPFRTVVWEPNEPPPGAPGDPACGGLPASLNVIDGAAALPTNAERLHEYIVQKLDEYAASHGGQRPPRIHLVGHSMGGLVIRWYLHTNRGRLPRIGRVIMIGTPNAGSSLADFLLVTGSILPGGLGAMAGWEATEYLKTGFVRDLMPRRLPSDARELYLMAGTSYLGDLHYAGTGPLLAALSPPGDRPNDGVVSRLSVSGSYMQLAPGPTAPLFVPVTCFEPDAIEEASASRSHTSLLADPCIANWVFNRLALGRNGATYGDLCGIFSNARLQNEEPDVEACTIESLATFATGIVQTPFPVHDAAPLAVYAAWGTAGNAFELRDPTGTIVPPTQSSIDPPMATFEVPNPTAGTWTAIFDASGAAPPGEPLLLHVSGGCDVRLTPTTKPQFAAGQEPVLSCVLTAMQGEEAVPVTGAVVQVIATLPDGSAVSVSLLDDGAHSDDAGNDGIYASVLSGSMAGGTYTVQYRADGVTTGGAVFRRVEQGAFDVSPAMAFIAGNLTDEAQDEDKDGHAERILLEVWVHSQEPGDFSLSGELVDPTTQVRLSAFEGFTVPSAGTAVINLHFDRRDIKPSGMYGPFTLENLQLLQHTSTATLWQDRYRDSYTTQTQLVVPPQVQVLEWRSVRTHGGTEDLAIVLNAGATGNGPGGPTVEPRLGGIRRVRAVLDSPTVLADPLGIAVTGRTTIEGTMSEPVVFHPDSVAMIDPTTLELMFEDGLPDATCYTISLAPGVFSTGLTGDLDVSIRSLLGDVTMDGAVTLTDALVVKTNVGTAASSEPRFDLDMSGGNVVTSDALAAKAQVSSPALRVVCP